MSLRAGCLSLVSTLVVTATASCVFDRSGIALLPRADRATLADHSSVLEQTLADVQLDSAGRDAKSVDALDAGRDASDGQRDTKRWLDVKPAADTKPASDTKPADTKPADTKPAQDSAGFKPVGTAEILAVWSATTVKCIDSSGSWNNTWIGILDNTGWAVLVDGSTTLAAAPAGTKSWVGAKPSVTVIFDPNSCGQEDPINNDGEWGSAGILIRGATLGAGKLVLSPGVTTADMDFLDVTSAGGFEGSSDFGGADDSGLAAYPQLAGVVDAFKKGILQAATK